MTTHQRVAPPADIVLIGSALPTGAQLRCPHCHSDQFTVGVDARDSLVLTCAADGCSATALTLDEWAPREATHD